MSTAQRIVILSDTHVGDRVEEIEPAFLGAIEAEQPDQIFHAGDVCHPKLIDQLQAIAPTLAVQGNRDWFLGYRLPKACQLTINGLKIVLTHGHFSIWHWFWNYVYLFLVRRIHNHTFYQRKLAKLFPDADVIIYGHLHYPHDENMDGQRFLNPGAGYPEWRNNSRPGYLVLTIFPDGTYTTAMKFTTLDIPANV